MQFKNKLLKSFKNEIPYHRRGLCQLPSTRHAFQFLSSRTLTTEDQQPNFNSASKTEFSHYIQKEILECNWSCEDDSHEMRSYLFIGEDTPPRRRIMSIEYEIMVDGVKKSVECHESLPRNLSDDNNRRRNDTIDASPRDSSPRFVSLTVPKLHCW